MRYAYVGCRTTKERNARGKGIEIYEVNDSNGSWTHVGTAGNLVNPSYLTFDHGKAFLYTVHGDFSEVSSFSVDRATGLLTLLGQTNCEGENPVFLTPDRSNKFILTANLQTGTIVALPRKNDGNLGPVAFKTTIPGIKEGDVSHPHQIIYDHSQSVLFVPSQGRKAGYSKTTVFTFSPETGFAVKFVLPTRDRAEARHVAVHLNNRWIYLINEKDNTVCFHTFDVATGCMIPIQILSTLPETYVGNGQASGIMVSHDGSHLYASNRIHDSVTIYAIDEKTGMLKTQGWVSTQGKTPRFITIDPTGQYLYAANEESDTILTFRIEENGSLTYTGQTIETGCPVCIVFSD